MNDYINIKQHWQESVSKRQQRYSVTERTNELTSQVEEHVYFRQPAG